MYSLKFAHLVKEKLPDCEVFEFYIDMRAFGKGYEEFYDRIRDEGVHVVRGRTATVEGSGDKLKLRTEDIVNGRLLDQELDMVILSVGLEPIAQAKQLAQLLGIPADKNNWFVEDWLDGAPTQTSNPGIHLAGACQGPKDIPDTVAQASAAAARVLQSIMEGHTWPPLGSLLTPTDVKPTSAPAQRSES
jgi:heterodisulfide reductase subunit A